MARGSPITANGDSFSLREWGEKRGVDFFLVSFVDLLGVLRSKLVPTAIIDQVQNVGAGFAGYAAHFDMTAADPDMYAFPDASSVIQLPWKRECAWLASDLYMDGKLVKQAPRQVLKEQISKALEQGFRMKTGVECEFFLLHGNTFTVSDDKDTETKPCYDMGSLMRRYSIITELFKYVEMLGWKPYQADHEDGNGQFEINWEYDDCLKTADKHVFFKFMAKTVAERHGYKASFMPKPFLRKTGNGAHCHISLWHESGESNLFHDENGELGLSKLAYTFLAGILANSKPLCAIFNPTVNSYKRIDGTNTASGSSWAPTSVSYSGNNRSHLIRIPAEGRFELRLPDGAVNPYLMQGAILASGLHGIEKQLDPGPRSDWNAHFPPPPGQKLQVLPNNLLEALQQLAASKPLRDHLGVDLIDSYMKVQMNQWKAYTSHLSRWELDNTLDC